VSFPRLDFVIPMPRRICRRHTDSYCLRNTRGNMAWQKRATWYGPGSSDRAAFGESARRVSGWDFDRIVPCHGDVIETGGKAKWDTLFSWFMEVKK